MEHIISVESNYSSEIAPEFTIVIPCYNYANYLPESVKSIVAQTFKDLEVIIVNDGSTDDTLEVARELLQKYKGRMFITLIDQEHQGHPSSTRNTGYSYARGNYYFALDSDDMIKPDYVAKAFETFEECPDVDIVYPGYQTFGDTDFFHVPPDFDLDSLKYWDYVPYSSVFKKDVFERLGGYDTSPSLRIMEDWDFWLRAYREGFRFKPIKEALLLHRTHRGSLLSSQKNWPSFAASVRFNNLSLFDEFDIEWARRILDSPVVEPYKGKKVLFIVDHFPPDVGGAERWALELGIEFVKCGLLVDVATLSLNRGFFYYNGLNIFEFEYKVGPYLPGDKLRFDELQEFVKKGDYDLILMKGGIRNWAIWSLDEPEKYPSVFVPIINKESVDFLNGEEKARKKLVERLKSAKVTISLTNTGHDAEFYCENDIPFRVIPNAVDFVSPTVDFKREMGIPSDTKLLLCVGSYYEVKNQLWLAESLRQMPGNWVLVTMGRVTSPPYYYRILSEVRGDHRFLVLAPQGKGVVAAAMEQADLLLLPSQAEVFGRVVLEAMSHRLPWIASTNCTGLKEVKGGKLAQLECEVDAGAIYSARRDKCLQDTGNLQSPFIKEVRRLLSDPVERERMGKEGYRDCRDNYRWKDFVGRYLDAIGLEPDPGHAVDFRRNTIDPKPAIPEYIELLRSQKKELPLVSVILITFNREELLKTAIQSVLDQTYSSFEVVVVNDGGTDVSQVVKQFDDSRITYINNPENLGPASARNVAIAASSGKYIAYIDDDDAYYPTHLETLVDALESRKEQVAYTDSYSVTMVGEGSRWCRKGKDVLYSGDFDKDVLFAHNYIPIICVMHNAELFEEVGGFDADLRYLEDWDLLIRMAARCDFKHLREITCEVSHRADKSHITYDRLDEDFIVTKAINDKYDGQVYRARDMVNEDIRSVVKRFEMINNYSLTDALVFLENSLELFVESPRLEYLCAQVYRAQKNWDRTKYHLERCLELDPGNAQASKDLAEAECNLIEMSGEALSVTGQSVGEIKEVTEEEQLEVTGKPPIIIPFPQTEEGARAVLSQLEAVTNNYSLIIVSNGFDDHDCIKESYPEHLVENPVDVEMARSINEGLELSNSEYVAVLRGDVLLHDEGWLENIITFLRRRKDVGLVGIAGWHSITEEGTPELMTPVLKLRGHPDSNKPTWRFTEVAAIDSAGWVMRNTGLRLSEEFLDSGLFALDLSLQFIKAGFRIYVAAIEFSLTEASENIDKRSAFAQADNGEDLFEIPEEALLDMRMKWEELLPLTRGFYDEAYVMNKVEELAGIRTEFWNLEKYTREVEAAFQSKFDELGEMAERVKKLEADIAAKDDALMHVIEHESQLEHALTTGTVGKLKNFIKRCLRKEPLKDK
jgi:glycosyltransferase involved in cell wall biosynthesis